MKTIRSTIITMLGTGLILGLLGVLGCSEDPANAPPASKKESESRRDEIQKRTQSGVPGKKAQGAGTAK